VGDEERRREEGEWKKVREGREKGGWKGERMEEKGKKEVCRREIEGGRREMERRKGVRSTRRRRTMERYDTFDKFVCTGDQVKLASMSSIRPVFQVWLGYNCAASTST
tara:strand:- start:400 stop:723 length:324 start_codon:yes stop_codon:yes gene_type:complete